jgi:hypothetical protein
LAKLKKIDFKIMLSICRRNFEILNKPLKKKKLLYFSHKVSHTERRYGANTHSDTFKELRKQSKITVSQTQRTSGASDGVGKKHPGWDCKRWRGLQEWLPQLVHQSGFLQVLINIKKKQRWFRKESPL